MNILNNYPDLASEICIPLIIAISAFALPLLLQSAARIDDKYQSTLLIKAFRKDWFCKFFLLTLSVSLLMVLIWALQFKSPIDSFLINNSALLLMAITLIVLIVATICIIYLIYTYYVPASLLKHLIKRYNKSKGEKVFYILASLLKHLIKRYNKLKEEKVFYVLASLLKYLIKRYNKSKKEEKAFYFNSISTLLFYSINKADEKLARDLVDFFSKTFSAYRYGKKDQIVEYPDEFYDNIFEANELLCKRERKTVSCFNDVSLYIYFIDEYQHTIISDKTFHFLWMCHVQSLYYGKDDFIMAYWKRAHQYFDLYLEPVEKICNKEYSKTLNIEEIQRRDIERERFLEFHYALGGLLLYREKYNLIKQITLWTNQQPPEYVLVPETMAEVITRFMDVSKKEDDSNCVYYEQKYPFPDISGVNADRIIKIWIKRYIAILFLRQYTLNEYFVYSNTLDMPNPPQTLKENRRWIDELKSLKFFVDDYLSKKEILEQLGLGELSSSNGFKENVKTSNWFKENGKTCPDDLIKRYSMEIEENIEQTKQNQCVDKDKEKNFEDATQKIISDAYNDYDKLFGETITEDYNKLFYNGCYQVMDKAAYAKDQEVYYDNADSFVAENVSNTFKLNALNIFMFMSKNQYLLGEEDLLDAIDKLNLDKKKFSIIVIGVNLDYFKEKNKKLIKKNDEWTYDEIPIVIANNKYFPQSFIIIKNEDLPCIIHHKISEEKIKKYNLEKLDEQNNTYASIIDLNDPKFSEVKDEVDKITNKDLSKSVLVCVDVCTEIRCKKSAKCIQLKLFSQFDDRGTANTLNNIKNIW